MGYSDPVVVYGFDRAHLVKPKDKADFRFATPPLTTPGEALGESVNLVVVAAGKSEQLSDESSSQQSR